MGKEILPQDVRLNIHPGDWYFGADYESLYTVLGSCVALTAWHPQLKIGGICHYLLPTVPSSQRHLDLSQNEHAGRYGKTALALMKRAMQAYAPLKDYQLGLFGGSDTLSNYGIGKQNILFAQHWLYDEQLVTKKMDVGGTVSRSLILTLATGVIDVKQYPMVAQSPLKKY